VPPTLGTKREVHHDVERLIWVFVCAISIHNSNSLTREIDRKQCKALPRRLFQPWMESVLYSAQSPIGLDHIMLKTRQDCLLDPQLTAPSPILIIYAPIERRSSRLLPQSAFVRAMATTRRL